MDIAQAIDSQPLTLNNKPMGEEQSFSLRNTVRETLKDYFYKLGGYDPSNLYDTVLEEMERPLIEVVLQRTRGNQSRAAKILGLSRGTLRKKMKQYSLD